MGRKPKQQDAEKKPTPKKQVERERTRYVGVYNRDCINRNTGKPDTIFDVTYKVNGKKVWVVLGYASDGINASFANMKRMELIKKASSREMPDKPQKVMTFDEAWAIFRERALVNVATPEADEGRYRNHIKPVFGHLRLDRITTFDMDTFRNTLQKKKLSPGTVHKLMADVRRVYRRMAAWGLYQGNIPTNGMTMPRVDNQRTRFLTKAEAVKLLDALRNRSTIWYGIAWMSLYTGMRLGEVISLRGEHIDFEGGQILVKDSKSGSRVLPMTDDVRAFLEGWPHAARHEYVFKADRSVEGPVRRDSGKVFARTVADLGLNDGISDPRHRVVFHTLRHTFCSWLAQAGVPLFTIGGLVGHTTTQMTQRYAHLCPDTRRAAASEIGKVFRGEGH